MMTLKKELGGALVLALLMLVVAVLSWSPETSLFFVASLGFHELGHLIPIMILGIPAYLTVAIWGVATVSDQKERAKLSEFLNAMIHLGGPAFNLVFALAALYMYQQDGSTNPYWLRLANTNALIGFVNILILGNTSDGGKFFRRLYASMPEWLDNMVMLLVSAASLSVLTWVAVGKGPSSVIWLAIIAVWVVISVFRADVEDDADKVPPRAMNVYERLASLVMYFGLWTLLFIVLIGTPFMITHEQAVKIAENAIIAAFMLVTNLPLLLGVVLFFISLTVPHELGHWFVGRLVGIKTRRMVLGSPKGSPWLTIRLFGLPVEFYRLPIMAAMDTDDNDLRTASLRANTAFSVAGPAVNVGMAFALLVFLVGLKAAFGFLMFVLGLMAQLIGAFLFGWLGWFGGSAFFFEAFGPINSAAVAIGLPQWALVFVVIHVFVALVNLLPIPGLDGGWVLMNLVIKAKTYWREHDASQSIYDAWLGFASKQMIKMLIVGSTLLTVVHFGLYFF